MHRYLAHLCGDADASGGRDDAPSARPGFSLEVPNAGTRCITDIVSFDRAIKETLVQLLVKECYADVLHGSSGTPAARGLRERIASSLIPGSADLLQRLAVLILFDNVFLQDECALEARGKAAPATLVWQNVHRYALALLEQEWAECQREAKGRIAQMDRRG